MRHPHKGLRLVVLRTRQIKKKEQDRSLPRFLRVSFVQPPGLVKRFNGNRRFDFNSRESTAVQGRIRAAIISIMRRGKFITFEGLDGTGKSTQMRKLARALRAAGYKVVETREPGGTATGEKIRRVLLDSATQGLSPQAEMALMFAARAQHIAEVILPALERGEIVLCDRFTDSTEAYQGYGRRLGSQAVLSLHKLLGGNLQPDLTVLLDSDPRMSLGRARRRNQQASRTKQTSLKKHAGDENRFEQENRAFFARVREGYDAIAVREPHRVIKVDASGTPGSTHRRIMKAIATAVNLSSHTR